MHTFNAGAVLAAATAAASCAVVVAHGGVAGGAATLSNVALPTDQNGDKLITGEASAMAHDGAYYFYFNNWGNCPGVDCCKSSAGCATCCFNDPPIPYTPGCGNLTNGSDPYGVYHTIQAYKTTDFTTWENLGVALDLKHRHAGTEFRPCVVFNKKTGMFVMWYEDRGGTQKGYNIAVSPNPQGPFTTTHTGVTLPGHGRVGDYNIFVDDDGKAYHVRTGFDIVQLTDDYTAGAMHIGSFTTPRASEGPTMFKRDGTYYVTAGSGCCACIGGSTIYVLASPSPAGPWHYQGDVGSVPGHTFDAHSPDNFVTKAQGSAVVLVGDQHVYLGNQWNSGLKLTPPGPRNHDLLYWGVFDFKANASGAATIQQMVWHDTTTITVPAPVPM